MCWFKKKVEKPGKMVPLWIQVKFTGDAGEILSEMIHVIGGKDRDYVNSHSLSNCRFYQHW